MQNRRQDTDFSATGARAAPLGTDVDVIVLTNDFDLLGVLQDGAGPEHILWHAQSANEAVELLVDGRCGVLIADLQVLQDDAAALLERLQAQFPELVLLAMGRREEESSIGQLVTSGRVYRFLHKPLSSTRARVFIGTAARRHVELNKTASPTINAVKQMAQQPAPRATFLGVVVGLVVLGGLWTMREPIGRVVDSIILEQNDPTPKIDPVIKADLAAARRALAEGRLLTPLGDNALERYRKVLALQSDNAEALSAVQRIVDMLKQEVVDALRGANIPQAAQAYANLQKADPSNRDLVDLRQQLLALSRGKKK